MERFKIHILSFILTAYVMIVDYTFLTPMIIESRMKDLNLLEYDSKENEMIPKDSVILTKADLRYLKTGTTKD